MSASAGPSSLSVLPCGTVSRTFRPVGVLVLVSVGCTLISGWKSSAPQPENPPLTCSGQVAASGAVNAEPGSHARALAVDTGASPQAVGSVRKASLARSTVGLQPGGSSCPLRM